MGHSTTTWHILSQLCYSFTWGEYQRRVYALAEKGQALTATTLTEIKTNVLSTFWEIL